MADVAPANGFGTTVMHPDAGTISLLYAEDGIDKWTTLTHWRPDAIDTRLATRTHFESGIMRALLLQLGLENVVIEDIANQTS